MTHRLCVNQHFSLFKNTLIAADILKLTKFKIPVNESKVINTDCEHDCLDSDTECS